MNVLLLCEGDAESWDSWSGTSKSIVEELRSQGHTVVLGDVDLYGKDRWLAAALTVSPSVRRWGTRFHLGGASFRLRSRRAARHIAAHRDQPDVILQIGATFEPLGRGSVPYFLCCDSNIRMAQHGASSGYSDAVHCTPAELEAIARREIQVYRNAAGIFTLSERLRRSFLEDFGLPADAVHAIYAGPNFDAAPLSLPRADLGRHEPTVLFVGRQFHRKGGDLVVQAFRRVQQQIPNARLIIAGPQELGAVPDGITYVGDLDKNDPKGRAALIALYSTADVFCLPTRFEPFGIAFVEAMFFSLPCIGTDAWAVPEMIVDGETGFTVPVDDLDALTDRLLRLLGDPALARTMGRAGKARAERCFTWERAVQTMLQVMLPVVGGAHC